MGTIEDEKYGKIIAPGVIRFRRLLPGSIEKVWAYLTESEKRAKWLASGHTELKSGGRVDFHFKHSDLSARDIPIPDKYKDMEDCHNFIGKVRQVNPPHLLSYTWGEDVEGVSEVTFELSPKGDQVELILTHRKLTEAMKVSVASGWHTHLGILEDVLANRSPRGFWEVSTEVEKVYRERMRV